MIKRSLYFGNPAYLSLKKEQLIVRLPEVEQNESLPLSFKNEATASFPIEDIGVVVLDHRQITITQALMEKLLANNCALISCDSKRMPVGLMLPLDGNTTQTERFRYQIDASLPLKKQLWQQTVKSKIENQAYVLHSLTGKVVSNMQHWAAKVRSGDPDNFEARAAVYYWRHLFADIEDFTRSREGVPPNNLLNYGYAILRALIARALVASGLLPTLGFHHRNKYNAYCLADDVMEPYRPFVDRLVFEIVASGIDITEITKDIKAKLLGIPVLDVMIGSQRSPLMIAASQTTASLYQCYAGETRKIKYPEFLHM